MPSIADVVELTDGSVGVVSDVIDRDYHRVQFPDGTRIDVLPAAVSQTLSAPTYEVGQDVTVWPDIGTIDAIGGSRVTLTLTKSKRIPRVAHIEWNPTVTVPLWRIILDNDGRLQRNYG